jgi:hypothetical protein
MTSYCLQFIAGFDYGPHSTTEGEPDFCEQALTLPRIETPIGDFKPEDITVELRRAWHDHFRLFGTHYIHLVHMVDPVQDGDGHSFSNVSSFKVEVQPSIEPHTLLLEGSSQLIDIRKHEPVDTVQSFPNHF